MWKLSIKSALSHKRRLVGTALSVVIGVAFLAGTFVFTDTIQRTFDDLFADVYNETDAVVRSDQTIDLEFGDSVRDRIPDSTIAAVAAVPGVSAAEGDVQGFARIIGSDGDALGMDNGPPTFGGNIADSPLSPWRLTEGSRFPSGPAEVVVDAGSAKDGDLEIGQAVTIIGQGGSRQFTLVGIARFGNADSAAGTSYALFDLPTAEEFVGRAGQVDAVLAKGDGTVDQAELAAAVRAALPADASLEVLTGEEISEETSNDIKEGLSFFTILLLVFAFISLFVSAFIIFNTFSIIAAQRQRETALLRAIGASRRTLLGSMLIEAVLIGLIATVLGFLGGIVMSSVLKAGMAALGVDIPAGAIVIKPRTAVFSLVVGVAVTVVAAIGPAFVASRVPPIAALRNVTIDRSGTSRRRLVVGAIVTAIAVVATVVGLTGEVLLLALGSLLLFIGLFILGPLVARPMSRLIGAPLPRLKGTTGTLARENAMRNPKRTAITAFALLIGVSLVTGITVLASSIKSSIREIFDEQFTGDLVISTNSFGFGGLPPQLAEEVGALPEVEAATGIGIGVGRINGDDETFSLFDPTTVGRVFDLEFVAGSVDDLTDDGILISKSTADDDGLALGDMLEITLLDGSVHPLAVQGIYDKDELAGAYSISKQLYATSEAADFDFSVFILKAEGVSDADATRAVEAVAADYPNGTVESRSDYIDSQAESINMIVNLFYGLLALAVVIAVFGIANTLSLSVHERTRELGLLRAVGMYRSQVRSAVRWESVITALLGAVEGIVVGIVLGYAVVYTLRDEGLDTFTLPVLALVVILVLAMVLGVIAAIRPARRAARLNILDAIGAE